MKYWTIAYGRIKWLRAKPLPVPTKEIEMALAKLRENRVEPANAEGEYLLMTPQGSFRVK